MLDFPNPNLVRPGAAKQNPFTVLLVANPSLESPWNSSAFVVDPIMSDEPAFDACVAYVHQSLFGGLPGQAETLLGDPIIAPQVRILSLFHTGLPLEDAYSFAAEDASSNLLIARRDAIRDFLIRENLLADVVYAVSASESHQRASAWFTSDDDSRNGVPFLLDGTTRFHRCWYRTPGTIALPASSIALTALHEFQHAISSYSNGMIVDQYVTTQVGVNVKRPQPPPPVFGHYTSPGTPMPGILASDPTRAPIGYPPGWTTFHCERHDPTNPAVMDNYWLAPGGAPEVCQNDRISREFVLDRVRAKLGR